MSTLTDDDLIRLLDEAASSYDVPEHGPGEVLAALAEQPAPLPIVRRRWVQLSAAAAVVTAGAVSAAAQYAGNAGSANKTTAASAGSGALTYGKGDAARRDLAQSPQFAPNAGDAFTSAGGAAAGAGAAGTRGQALPVPAPAGNLSGLRSSATGGTTAARLAPAAPAAAPVTAPVAPAVESPVDSGDARVVKTGTIALVVKDKRVTPTLTAVDNAAHAEGGYVSASSSDEYGDTPSGEVTIRVPVAHFESLVTRVRSLDAQVRTATTSGKDVTAQFADLDSQLRTLKATRERFLTILTKANTIGEILTVQQRIDTVSGQIDRIEGQKKLLTDQSDLSTLTVSVSEAGDPVVKATSKPQSGISQAFQNAWDGFVTGVESIISHSGRALLLLICAGIVLLIGRGGWKVARRRMV